MKNAENIKVRIPQFMAIGNDFFGYFKQTSKQLIIVLIVLIIEYKHDDQYPNSTLLTSAALAAANGKHSTPMKNHAAEGSPCNIMYPSNA